MGVQITGVEYWKYDLHLTRPYRISGDHITNAENAFIILQSADGTCGYGSGCPMPEISGEKIDDTIASLARVSEVLQSRTPYADLEGMLAALSAIPGLTPAARAAADIAIYDLYCKQHGMRVADFFGRHMDGMETSVTIGITTEEEVRETLRAHLSAGFTCVKLKIGEDIDHDIAMVHQMREWEGMRYRLRVDANQGYTIDQFRRFCRETAVAQIELVEQPFRSPATGQMQRLSEEEQMYCMADEDLVDIHDAEALVAAGRPYGLWNIKLMKCGGITLARHIATIAQTQQIGLMWGCNDESRVSIAAALHLAVASQATRYLDLDGAFDLAYDLATGGFAVKEGKMYLTGCPGLGVRLERP